MEKMSVQLHLFGRRTPHRSFIRASKNLAKMTEEQIKCLFEAFKEVDLIEGGPSAITNVLAEKVKLEEQELRNLILAFFYILLNWSIKAISAEELEEDLHKLGFQRNIVELIISNLERLPDEVTKTIRKIGAEHALAAYESVYIGTEASLTTHSVYLDEDRFVGVIPVVNFTIKIGKDGRIESSSCLMTLKEFAELVEYLENRRKVFKELLEKIYKGVGKVFLADLNELEMGERK